MASATASEVYRAALAAGFTPDEATTMTAIAGAESNFNPTAVGDVGLETDTWGPSFGAFQIRTEKSQTGKGTDRDINYLAGGLDAQAKAAYDISKSGTTLTPWSTFTNGAYQKFLTVAQTAAAAVNGSKSTASSATVPVGSGSQPFPTFGPSWLPWNLPSDAGNAAAGEVGSLLGGARTIVIEAAAALAGAGLVIGGIYLLAKPHIRAANREIDKVGKTAAAAAV